MQLYPTGHSSIVTTSVGYMVYVICQFHASVNRAIPETDLEFSLKCMEFLHQETCLAKFNIPPRLTPAVILGYKILYKYLLIHKRISWSKAWWHIAK